jgi:hypothetical protein
MSNIPINNLPAAIAVTGTEIIPAVQDNTTVRITVNQIKATLQTVGTVTQINTLAPISGGPITLTGIISLNAQGVTNDYLGPMPTKTIKGNATLASASPQDLTVSDTLNLLGIGGIATGTFLGNITGGPANPSPITLSNYIDTVIGNTQGSILYRSGTTWTTLPASTSGRYLQTKGPTANPAWVDLPAVTAVTSITAGTGLSGGTITTSGTISIANTGVTLGAYGSSASVPVFTVNAQGQLTAARSATIDAVTLTTGTITGTPVNPTDIVNKQYADAVAAGLKFHNSCNYATTGNLTATYNNGASGVGATLTNSGALAALAVDGGSVVVGNRILVRAQTNAAQNGVYTVTTVGSGAAAWVLTRATDYDTAGLLPNQIDQGDFIFVTSGTLYGSSSWVQQTPRPIIVGTTAIVFVQFSKLTTYTAGTGLTLTGSTFSITNTAVTAGAYGSASSVGTFTVNAQGQLTAAANANIAVDASAITTGTLGVGRGGTGLQSFTAGNLLYATAATTLAGLPIGTAGQVLTVSATGLPAWINSNGGVQSFSAGTTGLLPAGATQGAITLTGTLNIANGGTGAITAAAARTNLGLGTMAIQNAVSVAITGGAINGTIIGATTPAAITGTTISSNFGMAAGTQGVYSYGTLSYSDSGIMASFASNTTSYNQVVLQNTSNNPAASTNLNVSNDAATATANFGEFGINSSAFSGAGSFNRPGAVYLASASTDLVIGTYGANAIHFVAASGTTDAVTIASNGSVSFPTTGSITIPVGNTATRPVTAVAGMFRFNNQTTTFEGYNGTVWTSATGGVTSFSAINTGLTPNVATNGDVVLSGVLNGATGGTGVANTGKTITLGGNFATVGGFSITFTASAATSLILPTTGTVVTTTATQTLTNKRFTPRVVSIATATAITPPSDTCDTYDVTALATGTTISAPSGTPTNSQKILIRIYSAAAQALAWDTATYRPVGFTLPTSTGAGKWTYIGTVYNSNDLKWDVIAVGQQA